MYEKEPANFSLFVPKEFIACDPLDVVRHEVELFGHLHVRMDQVQEDRGGHDCPGVQQGIVRLV